MTSAQPDAPKQYVCVATVFHVRRWRHVLPLMKMANAVARQAQESPGIVRYGLRANLFKRRFWTVSVWDDPASIKTFMQAEPHATAMRMSPEWAGGGAAFVRWESEDRAVDWKVAEERLRTSGRQYRLPNP
ncbi:MAG: DUF3291 domain-containing protein [SAR202 cluster bacterium]|nr:DUF3291 domain-containing protein [SAR202 cluster bacterium]